MQTTILTDKELVNDFLLGENRAFDILIDKYRNKIYAILMVRLKDPDLADDLTQEVVIKIFDKISNGKYKDDDNFMGWVSRVTTNHCMDYFRKVKRSIEIVMINEEDDEYHIANGFVQSVETTIIREQMQVDVRGMIEKLPPEQREVIVLRQYADKSFKEIAEIRKESVNTSLGRMRYALNNLRKMIKHG